MDETIIQSTSPPKKTLHTPEVHVTSIRLSWAPGVRTLELEYLMSKRPTVPAALASVPSGVVLQGQSAFKIVRKGRFSTFTFLKKRKWGPQLPSYFLKFKIEATTNKVQAPVYLPTFL